MSIIEKLQKTIDLWIPDKDQENVKKGHTFERYVAEKFSSNPKFFAIEEWSADNHDKAAGIKVEANQNPDMVIRFKPTNERFAVECKYRTNPSTDQKNGSHVISFAKRHQIENYKKYSRKQQIPVFIVIGLGGRPDSPEAMFCLPLEEAKYEELYFSLLNQYKKKNPESGFFWSNGNLT